MIATRVSATLMLVLWAGCTGAVGGGDIQRPTGPAGNDPGDPGTLPPGGGGPGSGGVLCQETAPLVAAARRLTRDQYVNTLRDLLGDSAIAMAQQIAKDDSSATIAFDPRSLIVSPDWASDAMTVAEAVAKGAVANITSIAPCATPANEQGCATTFITTFGKRAYRRPLDLAEVDGLKKIYDIGAKNGGYSHGVEVVLRGMLQSPAFLYRLELGQKAGSTAGSVKLSSHEVATRLAFLLWNSTPDQALLDAADGNKLGTDAEIAAAARRLLADPRARETLTSFHGRWFGIGGLSEVPKDPAKYPQFDDKLITAMSTEVKMFVDDVLFKGDGRMESLFTSGFTYVDATLAPLYKVAAPAGGAFTRVDLNPAQRAGILTNAGIISAHTFDDASQPIHRGKFVREALLCTVLPDPPPDLNVMPPVPTPGVSTRQKLIEHSNTPSCKVCHVMMDPIGFGFEGYDGLGRFLTVDSNGQPVDNSGELTGTKDADGPFHGAVELSKKLSTSASVRDCLIGNVVRFAQGPDAADDSCVQQKMNAAFDATKHDVKELFVSMARVDSFRYRRAIAGEVLP